MVDLAVVAFIAVCGVSPINSWVGDTDTGPTCVHVTKGFETIPSCRKFIDMIDDQTQTIEEQRVLSVIAQIRGPWTFKADCRLPYKEHYIKELVGPPRKKLD